MAKTTRRSFLQISGALALGACGDPSAAADPDDTASELAFEEPALAAVPGLALDGLPVRAGSFPYGVMAGDATDTRVMLWTKYTGGGTLGVQIEAASGAGGMAVASRALTSAEQGDAGFMHVDMTGLTGGTRYRYAFFISEGGRAVARSPFGYVRAAL
jgi:phosphodiesterase/alkaline phosphatase D-like protein